MKQVLQDDRRFVLRFDQGEELIAGLKIFLAGEQIQASAFSAIGACASAELLYFNLETKAYQNKIIKEDLEVVSLTGNSAVLNGEVVLHAHGVLSKADFSTLGGHIKALTVSATCEVFLIKLEGQMERRLDPGMNLNFLI